MASNSSNNRNQDDSENRRNARRKQNVEPARTAPDSERGLTHSPYFNGPLYKRMSEDLHLGGMAKRTHEGYLRAVRQLADFCKRSPDSDHRRSASRILSAPEEREGVRQRITASCLQRRQVLLHSHLQTQVGDAGADENQRREISAGSFDDRTESSRD